jgi:glycosyltransferase involved in cell wall biosynthesis
MFGEDEYEKMIRQMVVDLGLEDNVEFTGYVTDVPQRVAKLDVLVHASTTGEPFGQVVIEGMVAGKPVIATRGGGVVEIVEDGVTGILVPMSDAKAMAEALVRLLADPASAAAMGLCGRVRVLQHFTIEQTANKVHEIYAEFME